MIPTLLAHLILWAIPDAEITAGDYKYLCYVEHNEVIVIETAWLELWAAGEVPIEMAPDSSHVTTEQQAYAWAWCFLETGHQPFINNYWAVWNGQ